MKLAKETFETWTYTFSYFRLDFVVDVFFSFCFKAFFVITLKIQERRKEKSVCARSYLFPFLFFFEIHSVPGTVNDLIDIPSKLELNGL